MKRLTYLCASIIGVFIPIIASAHVKWFVNTEEVVESAHGVTQFYSWGSKEVLLWSLIVLVTVFIFSLIDRVARAPKGLIAFGIKHEKVINRIAQIVLGLFLVFVSLLWKIIIVPELPIHSTITVILEYIQILIGLLFIFNIKPRLASVGLMFFCFGLLPALGFQAFFENAILLSLAFYFFIINSKPDSKIFRYNKHAIEIVRIGTGVSLIVLAFTEKLIYPELGLQFLQVHHWNFMQPLFPWFSDKFFVLSTGFAEMIFGILFILGYITRVTTVLIAVFFGLSVSTMLIQFHAWEVEDLVVYSAAILFIFYGHGRTKFFHLMWPNSNLQKSIISNNH